MKKLFIVCLLFTMVQRLCAQTYLTRNGFIAISSHTPLEDINAENNEVASVLNAATGDFDFKVAIKSFHFKKTAMEEHFNNPDYMDSEKFPKAGFKGKIANLAAVNFSKDGTYKVSVQGNLTIRDVTKPVTADGTITIANGVVSAESTFNINRKEYNVIGESFVQKKIAEQIQLTVKCKYDKR